MSTLLIVVGIISFLFFITLLAVIGIVVYYKFYRKSVIDIPPNNPIEIILTPKYVGGHTVGIHLSEQGDSNSLHEPVTITKILPLDHAYDGNGKPIISEPQTLISPNSKRIRFAKGDFSTHRAVIWTLPQTPSELPQRFLETEFGKQFAASIEIMNTVDWVKRIAQDKHSTVREVIDQMRGGEIGTAQIQSMLDIVQTVATQGNKMPDINIQKKVQNEKLG